jgi:pimeloyl-ACP methyl ester carboxylesterase
MGLTGRLLFDTAVAMAALVVGVIFLIFRNELSRAHDAASHGSLVANTRAGPIEYAEKGVAVPLLSIHGAGGRFDQGLANAAEFVDDGYRIIAPSRFG